MAIKRIARPRDPIALAKLIGDIATGQVTDGVEELTHYQFLGGQSSPERGGRSRTSPGTKKAPA